MSLQKQRVNEYCQNNQFGEAKKILLQMIESDAENCKLFTKLGDISIELNKYDDAQNYYQQSIHINASNEFIYIKLGNLLHEYLDKLNEAEKAYQKCIKLNPNNELCWFNYGKLMHKNRNFSKAEECYLQCKIERACINYHYALLLLSQSLNKNNQQKAQTLLLKATKLRPNVTKYHHQYALCLINSGMYSVANTSFLTALKLSEYQDIPILSDYSIFLSQQMNDTEASIKYLEIALDLDKNNNYPHIRQQYENLYQSMSNMPISVGFDSSIKLLIYGFDETITYWDSYKVIHGNIENLKRMRQKDLVWNIFGGTDRLTRLHQHFRRILTSPNKVRLAILSYNLLNCIIVMLKRVNLFQYFVKGDIIQMDVNKNKLDDIMDLSNEYNLNISTEVLFIDDQKEYIESASNHCKTYHVTSEYTMNGLSLKHMHEIETIVGVEDESDKLESIRLEHKLNEIDCTAYHAIKYEIGRMKDTDSVDDLPVITWICRNWTERECLPHFIFFAKKYREIRICLKNKYDWTINHILPQLLDITVDDNELNHRYGSTLFYLSHYEAAEYYHKLAVKSINPNPCWLLEYSRLLFEMERYVDAEQYFVKTIDRINEIRYKGQVYCRYARTLILLEQPKKAEKYFKLSINEIMKGEKGEMPHIYYGIFLFDERRYNESKYQFEKAIDVNPRSAIHHWRLSKVLFKLGDIDGFRYHLNKSLELEPHLNEANIDWNRYYHAIIGGNIQQNDDIYYNRSHIETDVVMKKTMDNDYYFVEFDRFWLDTIGIVNARFNTYYDKFVSNKMNDIRCILFDNDIGSKLQRIMYVEHVKDNQLIMKHIRKIQGQHKLFVNVLNDKHLQQYYPIFACSAIYTMDAMHCYVKDKYDARKVITYYNQQNAHCTRQFNVESAIVDIVRVIK